MYPQTIANDFLSSTLTTEEFLTKFVERRKDSHLRRVRAEKAADLLREQNRVPAALPAFPRYVPPGGEYQPPSLPNMAPPMGLRPMYGPNQPMPPYGVPPYLPYPAPYTPTGAMSMPTPGS